MTRVSSTLINASLVVISLVVGATVAELAARLILFGSPSFHSTHYTRLWQPDLTLGWKLRPNLDVWLRTIDYSVHFQTNSKGFNDVEHSYHRSGDGMRVIVLGDSFIEAHQVPRQDSFAFQLSSRLIDDLNGEDPEVINLGVGGFGTTQEYLMLREEGTKYAPDLVLLAWLPVNDVRNNHRSLETMIWGTPETPKVRGRPFAGINADESLSIAPPDAEFTSQWLSEFGKTPEQGEKRTLTDRFLILYYVERLLERWKERRVPQYDPNVWLGGYLTKFDPALSTTKITEEEYEQIWGEAETVSWKVLKAIRGYSEGLGARFCVFTVPTKFQVELDFQARVVRTYPSLEFDPEKLNNKLRQVAEEENICLIDLLPAFLSEYQSCGEPLHHQHEDRHWNTRGHAVAARVVSEALTRKQSMSID